jgi:choline kinase/DNA-binding MarR family transcriptional regulator
VGYNELQILELLNKKNDFSQRQLSKETGLSLGTINSVLKNLVQQQYIKAECVNSKTTYEISLEGIEILEKYLSIIQGKRIHISPNQAKRVTQAVILSAGYRADFEKPVCFLEVKGKRLIDRQIEILRNNGINRIVIVAGFKPELYRDLPEEIVVVYNNEYRTTGTMASLSVARDEIYDDFLLIEGDLYFEEKAVAALIEHQNRNSVLITKVSESGDEAFVEIRNNYIYKMSKDISQFNVVHGEMIGMSKISIEIYEKMLEEFSCNQNPYVNYEYIMMDVAGRYSVGYLKIDDLQWSEIDNINQYEKAKEVASKNGGI